jgi:hypothetical protein
MAWAGNRVVGLGEDAAPEDGRRATSNDSKSGPQRQDLLQQGGLPEDHDRRPEGPGLRDHALRKCDHPLPLPAPERREPDHSQLRAGDGRGVGGALPVESVNGKSAPVPVKDLKGG